MATCFNKDIVKGQLACLEKVLQQDNTKKQRVRLVRWLRGYRRWPPRQNLTPRPTLLEKTPERSPLTFTCMSVPPHFLSRSGKRGVCGYSSNWLSILCQKQSVWALACFAEVRGGGEEAKSINLKLEKYQSGDPSKMETWFSRILTGKRNSVGGSWAGSKDTKIVVLSSRNKK